MKELGGKVAVVTGGGSGIGAAISRALAHANMRVAVLDIDIDGAEQVATQIRSRGAEARAYRADVTSSAELESVAEQVEADLGACHVVCANAGVLQMGRLDSRTDSDWEWCLSVNVMGTVRTVRAFLPALRRQAGEKHIVITSSMSGLLACGPAKGIYNTTKHAQMAIGETLRAELADEGIGVSLLLPAAVESRITESARNRPSELGTTEITQQDIETLVSALGEDATEMLTADQAVRNLVRGIQENAPWIVTHAAQRSLVEERFEGILAAFDRAEFG